MRFTHFYLTKQYITEGGAYGHLLHLYEDDELTFGQLKDIINKALSGKLEKLSEKTDGQQISISWINEKLKFARNKGHMKNHGANALDAKGISTMFAGRGDIEQAFTKASQDLTNAFSKIPKDEIDKVFENGKKWLSVEIIYPATKNVIPYNTSMIIPHGVIEVDDAGNPIHEDKDVARWLFKVIEDADLSIQKNFKLTHPNDIKGLTVPDFAKQRDLYISQINKLMDEYDLNDENTILDYKKKVWREFLDKTYDINDKTIGSKELVDSIVNRYAADDKSENISNIKKMVDNKEFVDNLTDIENNKPKIQKNLMKSLEILIIKLGATVLRNMTKFLAADPDKAKQELKKELEDKISQLEKSDDPKVIDKLNQELDKLQELGGLESILPTEGVTFMYNGKVYKFTGSFAPANQILGMGRFNR